LEKVTAVYDKIAAFVSSVREMLRKAEGESAWALLETAVLAGSYLAASREFKAAVFAYVSNPVALGTLVGTVAGFIMWEIMVEVFTAGIGWIGGASKMTKAVQAATGLVL
jgi:hypothetical protein